MLSTLPMNNTPSSDARKHPAMMSPCRARRPVRQTPSNNMTANANRPITPCSNRMATGMLHTCQGKSSSTLKNQRSRAREKPPLSVRSAPSSFSRRTLSRSRLAAEVFCRDNLTGACNSPDPAPTSPLAKRIWCSSHCLPSLAAVPKTQRPEVSSHFSHYLFSRCRICQQRSYIFKYNTRFWKIGYITQVLLKLNFVCHQLSK